ncbi:MAG TPA: YtxH domain-containing protein [Gemmatimonadaceae bacterium]|nr:YtxH domain-containing protein [Gemmatimonadaceae bacterium]
MARTTEFNRASTGQAGSGPLDHLDSTARAPRGRSYDSDGVRSATIFGAGLAVGALLGAGAALLFAPQSGDETRELLAERAQRLGGRMSERLDDVRGDLGWYLRRGRRKLGRGASRGRWAGEDLADRLRKGW